jgi:hypothetical protein
LRAAIVIIAPAQWSKSMIARAAVLVVAVWIAVVLACSMSPAAAGQSWHHCHCGRWRAAHAAIYELENRIAYLEADPEIDDGYKAPIITRARADVLTLRVTLRPAHWRWASPCCYGRRPIRIR